MVFLPCLVSGPIYVVGEDEKNAAVVILVEELHVHRSICSSPHSLEDSTADGSP